MKLFRREEEIGVVWRVAMLLGVVLLAFAVTISVAIWQTVGRINETESSRNRVAVAAAFMRELARVEALARSNNDWDDEVFEDDFGRDAVRSLGGAPVRRIESDSDFDEIWVQDANGRLLLTIAREGNPRALHGPTDATTVDAMAAATLRTGMPQSVFVRHEGGLAAYATAMLDARSDFMREVPGSAGGVLVVHENVAGEFLADTASMLQLGKLELYPSAAMSDDSIVVAGAKDAAPVSVRWPGGSSRLDLVLAELPVILLIASVFLALTYFLARRLFSSFRYLSRQARLDWLSNLPNRWALQHAIRIAARADEVMTLALVDLDSFKTINDYHGHSTGDHVIRHIARRLRALMPEDAFVARIGGDEFAVLLTGPGSLPHINVAVATLLDDLTAPFRAGSHSVQIGASVGIAMITGEVRGGELLRRADIAMYVAKRNGKMGVAHYEAEMDADAAADIAMKDDLAAAIAQQGLTLKYQPIIDARSGEILSIESLARWTSATHGIVPADRFIPLAEKFGLITALSTDLFERACRDCVTLPGVRLSVNISVSQIDRADFPAFVAGILGKTGLSPHRLEIEITETSLVRGGARARAVLESLSDMGIRLTLDDFGTGFASIGFLRQFRFDALKIDRSIVADSTRSAAARGVVVACVAMARALDIEVVAEGVETEEEAALMRAEGCQQLQGWLFCRAVELDDIRARLNLQRAA
jgi:diguanylate cyclase (GGDEF)-like protein